LVPSRSTVFGLFLHIGEPFGFWPELVVQTATTIWVISLSLRVLRLGQTQWGMAVIVAALSILTGLPWLTSLLLTDIFAGLAALSLHLMLFHSHQLGRWERSSLFLIGAFSAATHSATMAVLIALLVGATAISLFRPAPIAQLYQGAAAIALGALMLVAANFALARQVAWTPGGYGIAFGRMLQDGIVTRYLADHCPDARLRLCPYRNELPATADEFLWGDSPFDRLGRFAGLGDEMRQIVLESLVEYPDRQIAAAITSTAKQLVMVGSGYGVNDQLPHTHGIIERYIPFQVPAMRAARQQLGEFDFRPLNRLHVPIALLSMMITFAIIVWSLAFGGIDDVAMLATSVLLAILANAFICGALSGPHDRYGARIVWLATFTVAVALMRYRTRRDFGMTALGDFDFGAAGMEIRRCNAGKPHSFKLKRAISKRRSIVIA